MKLGSILAICLALGIPYGDLGAMAYEDDRYINWIRSQEERPCTDWGWKFYDGYDLNNADLGINIPAGDRNECQGHCHSTQGNDDLVNLEL